MQVMIKARTGQGVEVASKERGDRGLAKTSDQVRDHRAMEWYLDVVEGRKHLPDSRPHKLKVVDVAQMWGVDPSTVYEGITKIRAIRQAAAELAACGYE